MAGIAVLSAAIVLSILVLAAWYARGRAIADAKRLEGEGARGREIECIAMDAASLLAATLQSIDTAREIARSDPSDVEPALDNAASAASALSALFSGSRLYLRAQADAVMHGPAEGCVRVAIAVARSRGGGISVRGERTSLELRGRAREACELVVCVLDACRTTLAPGEFVEVRLDETAVHVLGGTERALDVASEGASSLGWFLEPTEVEGRPGVSIRALAHDDEGERGSALSVASPRLLPRG